MQQPQFFTMKGPLAELWANGAPVGTLAHWTLTATAVDRFRLTAQAADGVAAIANLPPSLRPPLEWRVPWGDGVLAAPVRMRDALTYAGLAKPVALKGRVR